MAPLCWKASRKVLTLSLNTCISQLPSLKKFSVRSSQKRTGTRFFVTTALFISDCLQTKGRAFHFHLQRRTSPARDKWRTGRFCHEHNRLSNALGLDEVSVAHMSTHECITSWLIVVSMTMWINNGIDNCTFWSSCRNAKPSQTMQVADCTKRSLSCDRHIYTSRAKNALDTVLCPSIMPRHFAFVDLEGALVQINAS